jgi:hypothetical protein
MGQRGLPDTGCSDDHQALARGPGRLLPRAPQRLGVGPGLGDEAPSVGDEPGEPALAGGERTLALGPDLRLHLAADGVRIGARLHRALGGPDAGGTQAAQVGHPAHDARVVDGAADGGHGVGKLVDVDHTPDPLQVVLRAQLM